MKASAGLALVVFGASLSANAMARWVDQRSWRCPGTEKQVMNCDVVQLRSERHPIKIIQCVGNDANSYLLLNFESELKTSEIVPLFFNPTTASIRYNHRGVSFLFFKNIQNRYAVMHTERVWGVFNKTISEYSCQFAVQR